MSPGNYPNQYIHITKSSCGIRLGSTGSAQNKMSMKIHTQNYNHIFQCQRFHYYMAHGILQPVPILKQLLYSWRWYFGISYSQTLYTQHRLICIILWTANLMHFQFNSLIPTNIPLACPALSFPTSTLHWPRDPISALSCRVKILWSTGQKNERYKL